jgi:hypothetical protein
MRIGVRFGPFRVSTSTRRRRHRSRSRQPSWHATGRVTTPDGRESTSAAITTTVPSPRRSAALAPFASRSNAARISTSSHASAQRLPPVGPHVSVR